MELTIAERNVMNKDVVEIAFDICGKEFAFQAGQYIEVTLPQLSYADARGKSRKFFITSAPSNRELLSIAFDTSDSGFKKALIEMPLGSEVTVQGPFGDMFLPEDTTSPVVFIADGIGIAPFLSMLRSALEEKRPNHFFLFQTNTKLENTALSAELLDMQKTNPQLIICNHVGAVDTLLLTEHIDSAVMKTAFWYVVGPQSMTVSTIKTLEELAVLQDHIRFEELSGYHSLPEETWQFQEVVEKTTQHIIITDANGIIVYANAAVQETTGYTPEEVIGNTPALWGRQMPREAYDDLWRTIKDEKKSFTGELVNKRKNGELYTVFANISPIIDSSGNVEFFIGMETDISKQKEFETLLLKEKDSLEKINRFMVNRELKMVELKGEVTRLTGPSKRTN